MGTGRRVKRLRATRPSRPAIDLGGDWQQIAYPDQIVGGSAKVNIQPTRAKPRWRVLRKPPTVLTQPKISSTRLRFC